MGLCVAVTVVKASAAESYTRTLIDKGVLRTTLDQTFGTINAANLKRAHALLESGKSRGKIVLEGW